MDMAGPGLQSEGGLTTGTLNRYVFSKAAFMCAASWLSLSLLVFASVFLGNIGLFNDYDASGAVIARFMLCSTPQMIHWVLPFSVCVGIIATQASFSRHVETIAMQACSVSFARLSIPYLTVSLIAVLIMAALSFSIYPLAQREAEKIEQVSIKKRGVEGSFSVHGGRFKIGGDIYRVQHVDIPHGIIRNITCYRIREGRITTILRADTATWNGRTWHSPNLETIRLSPGNISVDHGESILPLAHPPSDLAIAQPSPDVLTLGELLAYRKHLREGGIRSVNLDTQIHSRISFAMAPLIMTLLVLPFGLRFPRAGGIARGISVGIVLGLVYWAVHSAMTSAGMSGYIHPALAAWSADLAAMAAGVILMRRRRATYG
ncbi:MAG TPA: LptF/LptG family permease [Deltaproteobacteria bacterium]|nr:LptF/LptG family permease [Deltaproteobacteria bacterium]HPR53599.1 LptF/LptG family permease [Deltaproteobacteria bacterium]HXK47114.1 LptF/LptG family permease [Deltaproteobacteria bacterium]